MIIRYCKYEYRGILAYIYIFPWFLHEDVLQLSCQGFGILYLVYLFGVFSESNNRQSMISSRKQELAATRSNRWGALWNCKLLPPWKTLPMTGKKGVLSIWEVVNERKPIRIQSVLLTNYESWNNSLLSLPHSVEVWKFEGLLYISWPHWG